MKLISKSIYAPDVEADDRLIERMTALSTQKYSQYGWAEVRDIIVARYRNRNLRMRVLVAFHQTVKSKRLSNVLNAVIKAIDAEQSPDNVVCLDTVREQQDKAA